ncbi:MAG: signal recognition particle-docking protein FtsY [Chthonomonadales bacterium]|nr:signal recognition particle-docking protein FtsY [Chthonomonadales bacterium]
MRFGFVKSILQRVDTLVTGRGKIDEELFEELEDSLIQADINVRTVAQTLDSLRERVREDRVADPGAVKALLRELLKSTLQTSGMRAAALVNPPEKPGLYLFVGVNGTGKTTTIAKVAHRLRQSGSRVILAAADTFRAAAIEQIETWADRVGCEVVKHRPGADPSAVVFDAIKAAQARGADYVLADTAGRLQNKAPLMEELRKVTRVAERGLGRPPDEVLLVLDATTGQNGISQARVFTEVCDVSGIVLAKLDGTARGGIVVTIAEELGLPIKLVGSGERMTDLEDFDADAFVDALLA